MIDLEANLPPTYAREVRDQYTTHPAPTAAAERSVRLRVTPSTQANAAPESPAECCGGFWAAVFLIGFIISIYFNIRYATSGKCQPIL
ncbi:hypothetical protein NLG97_g747 [Lecanicillium saksenae]|uniref:Uncharacterized protein n=1 Tax=Lecanicillium saksenae TaxID=468837 RepID=A0ACC1R8D8_9HYPO|nr:hypothetical protein NLG97_g747 [Lecanicillium saksenae]